MYRPSFSIAHAVEMSTGTPTLLQAMAGKAQTIARRTKSIFTFSPYCRTGILRTPRHASDETAIVIKHYALLEFSESACSDAHQAHRAGKTMRRRKSKKLV